MKNKYYDDFRCCELKTTVKQVEEEKGFYWHVFDDTIFYVDGEYADQGKINQYDVIQLKEKDGIVYHLLSEKLEGEVFMVVQHARRYIHAQNETLALLLNEIMESVYHCESIDHYIGDLYTIHRYKGKGLTLQQKVEVQVTLNGMIRDDFPVKVMYEKISDERSVAIGLFKSRKSKKIQVPSLKFIQMVKILEVVEKEDEFMIFTTCGDQMLFSIEKYYEIIKEASTILNCEPSYVNTSIHHILNNLKATKE